MSDLKLQELIDKLDQVEAELRTQEGRLTLIRLTLLRELNKK